MKAIKSIQELKSVIYGFKALQKISAGLHHQDENACNYGLTPRQEKTVERLMREAQEIAGKCGLKAYHQRDPRGCSLYLMDKTCKDYYEGIAIF